MLQISEVNYSCCEQLKISSRPIMLFPFDVWKFKLCLLLIVGFLPSQCFAFAQELFQTFRRGINFWSVDISLLLLVWGPKMQVVQDKVQKEKYMIKEIQKYRGRHFLIRWYLLTAGGLAPNCKLCQTAGAGSTTAFFSSSSTRKYVFLGMCMVFLLVRLKTSFSKAM